MQDKLAVKWGIGFIFFDEFLRDNAENEMKATMLSTENDPQIDGGRRSTTRGATGMSPKRSSFTGAPSPKNARMSPRGKTAVMKWLKQLLTYFDFINYLLLWRLATQKTWAKLKKKRVNSSKSTKWRKSSQRCSTP